MATPVCVVSVDEKFNVSVQMPADLSEEALAEVASAVLVYVGKRLSPSTVPPPSLVPPPLVYMNHG